MTRPQGAVFGSERDDVQARDELKVPGIERGYIEAEMDGRGPDHQILEGDGDTLGRLFSLDLSSELRNLQRYGMHNQIVKGTLGEDAPPLAVCLGFCSIHTVGQFDDTDRRERDIYLTVHHPRIMKDIFDRATTPFGRDQDTRIKNQSHADVSRGLRFRMISSMSAAYSASMVGLQPSSFERASASAMDSEMERRGGAAA